MDRPPSSPIRQRMAELGITEAALAEASRIPRSTLQRRLDRPGTLSVDELAALAQVLDMDPVEALILATTPKSCQGAA